MTKLDVSIVIVTYNTEQITYDCIQSIYQSETKYSYEVIVVDNNSTDGTVDRLSQSFPLIIIIPLKDNLGFSKGNNVGIENSSGKYILLLNSDTILFKDSLENLLNTTIDKNYQIVGPILLNSDYTIQRSWFNFPSGIKILLRLINYSYFIYKISNSFFLKLFFLRKKPAFMLSEINEDRTMDYLSFACILINRDVFNHLGKLDESLFFYQEDCEFGLRIKNIYKFNYCVSSKIVHLGGSSSSHFSWLAFENDILGLLHIYKKHYSPIKFIQIKWIIILALQYRVFFTYFGLYKQLRNSGLYEKKSTIEKQESIRKKYLTLIDTVLKYK